MNIRAENLSKAKEKFLRRKRLFEMGVIPKEVLEEAERLYRNALREYEASLLNLEDTLKGLEKELSSLKEQRRSLERELSRYRIRSPIEGVVLRRFVEKGDYVNPLSRENALFSLGSPERKVVLQVDEELAPLLKEGQKAYITTDAVPGRVFEGRVARYDLESERTRRVVEVEVSVQLPESVPVGSVVEGNVVVSRLKTTVVPIDAVKDGFAVLVVNGEKRKVKVNRLFEDFAEVLGYPPGTPCLLRN
ncbi:MAG: efflux RND transporter periplasmic adaptor subunit [Aquificota bacterium]|nr:efflux RND transporter periplasmic adaptor subunit [Aquificota bacterium]